MPKSSIKQQELKQKQPYFLAAAACLVLILFAFGWFYDKVASDKAATLEQLKGKVEPLQRNKPILDSELNALTKGKGELENYAALIQDRAYWGRIFTALRETLLSVEGRQEEELKTKVGVWVEKFIPMNAGGPVFPGAKIDVPWPPEGNTNAPAPASPRKRRAGAANVAASTAPSGTNEITFVVMDCRGVNIASPPSANTTIAAALASELGKRNDFFDPAGTMLAGTLVPDPSGLTYKFSVVAKLKTPLKY